MSDEALRAVVAPLAQWPDADVRTAYRLSVLTVKEWHRQAAARALDDRAPGDARRTDADRTDGDRTDGDRTDADRKAAEEEAALFGQELLRRGLL